jgi:hypothetical protein
VAGDGGFSVYIYKLSKINSLRERLTYRFYITQHSKDLDLMKLFIKFFNCGVVHVRSNLATPRCDYIVQDASSLVEKIIPHFESYPVSNLKQKDFVNFKESMNLIKLNKHLTTEGLEKIKKLSLEMNSNRLN